MFETTLHIMYFSEYKGGMKSYTVYIEKDEDGVFIGPVPSLNGCHTQGNTLDELIPTYRK